MKSGLGILIFFSGVISAQTDDSELLSKNAHNITHAARSFEISPRLLASIVYVEQTENVKPGEKFLDVVFAHSGYNASVGFAQMKVSTGAWLEVQIHSRSGDFYLGENKRVLISPSRDRDELIRKLSADSVNLLYAAAYLAMIEKLWNNTLRAPWLQNSRIGILATLYSLGIVKPDGSLRMPHDHAAMSQFGRVAQAFFDSFMLREEFPE